MTTALELHPNSKRTPQALATIREALSYGLEYKHAAALAGVTYETLRCWRRDDPVLAAELEQCKAGVVLRGAAKLVSIIDAIDPDDPNPVAVRALLAFLKARAPEFRDAIDPGDTGEGDQRVPVLVTVRPAESVDEWTAAHRAPEAGN